MIFWPSCRLLILLFLLLSGVAAANPCSREFSYLTRNATSYEENVAFIQAAEAHQKGLYFSVDTAILKELNDKVLNDKSLVTELDNFYKARLLGAVEADPLLKQSLRAKYSDYKSIQFLFSDSPDLKRRLELCYQSANQSLAKAVADRGISLSGTRGLAVNPETWHLAGIGNSLEESSLAGRAARTKTIDNRSISAIEFAGEAQSFRKSMGTIQEYRAYIERWFRNIPRLLEKTSSGKFVLTTDAIKILKAMKPEVDTRENYIAELRKAFLKNFGVEPTADQAVILRDYLAKVDVFSPPLLIPRRTVINLGEATSGIVSVDFSGQGARNLNKMMAFIADSEDRDLSYTLSAIRNSERAATQELDLKKSAIQKNMDLSLGSGKTLFSGDDGVFFPTEALSDAAKHAYLKAVFQSGQDPSSFRITFLPKTYLGSPELIAGDKRSSFIVAAEGLEKELRDRLQGLVPLNQKHNMLFAIDFAPEASGTNHLAKLLALGVDDQWKKVVDDTFAQILAEKGYQKTNADFFR